MDVFSGDLFNDILLTIDGRRQWSTVLNKMVRQLDARSARILELNADATRVHQSVMANHDESYIRQYVDYYVNSCPWRPELKYLHSGQLYSTYTDFSCKQKQFYNSEFYVDWAKPQDIAHGLCGTIYQTATSKVQLMFQRTKRQGHFTLEEKYRVNQYVPVMQRAIELRQQFITIEQQVQAIETAAPDTSPPFMLLRLDGSVHHCSSGLEKLLKALEPVLKIRKGRIFFNLSKNQSLWDRFFTNARNLTGIKMGGIKLVGSNLKICQIKITVLPDSLQSIGFLGSPEPLVVAYFYQIGDVILDDQYLADQYQLTPTEIKVVTALANGMDLKAIKHQLKVSGNTVRTHLNSAYRKTGIHSQSALVHGMITDPAARASSAIEH